MSKSLGVVIPAYNAMPFIVETVNSALRNLPPDAEIVIGDNCSTDGTGDYIRSIKDPRVIQLHFDDFLEPALNWERSLRASSAAWIKLLPADDLLWSDGEPVGQFKDTLSLSGVAVFAEHTRIISASGRALGTRRNLRSGRYNKNDVARRILRSGANVFGETSSVWIRRDAALASLPFTAEFPYVTDLDFLFRCMAFGDLVVNERIGASFRVHSGSWSRRLASSQFRQTVDWGTVHLAKFGSRRELLMFRLMVKVRTAQRRLISSLLKLFE